MHSDNVLESREKETLDRGFVNQIVRSAQREQGIQVLKKIPTFVDCVFTDGMNLSGIDEMRTMLSFQKCTFKSHVLLVGCHYYASVEFSSCIFEKEFEIGGCGFKREFKIENSVLQEKLNLWDSVFFDNVHFNQNDFLGGTNLFEKYVSYGGVEFKGGLHF